MGPLNVCQMMHGALAEVTGHQRCKAIEKERGRIIENFFAGSSLANNPTSDRQVSICFQSKFLIKRTRFWRLLEIA